MFIPINGHRVHTVSFGTGPRTILMHGGWIGSWELWQQPMEELSRGWRTVAYDHRGTGETKTPVAEITADGLVSDVFGVLDAYGIDRCVIASESAGAQTILSAVAQAPSRFAAVVIVAGLLKRERVDSDAAVIAAMRHDFPRFLHGFVDTCLPEDTEGYLRQWGRDIVQRTTAEQAIRLFELQYETDVTSVLASIQIPALFLHGDLDQIVPIASVRTAVAARAQYEFIEMPQVGHVPTVSRPREVVRAMEAFLSRSLLPDR
jgi:pimeloyl-ACP methyl ester carboxylesterase